DSRRGTAHTPHGGLGGRCTTSSPCHAPSRGPLGLCPDVEWQSAFHLGLYPGGDSPAPAPSYSAFLTPNGGPHSALCLPLPGTDRGTGQPGAAGGAGTG